MKKPVLRTLDAVLQISRDSGPVPIHLHVVDLQMGLDRHAVTITRRDGGAISLTGTLAGVTFHPKERRGAPTKLSRDMALYMAVRLFACGGKATTAQARQQVLELWVCNNWRGIQDESTLNKKLKTAIAEIRRLGCSVYMHDCSPVKDGFVVLAPEKTFDLAPSQHASLLGDGWFWRYGTEKAIFGSLRFDTPLEA